MRQSSGKERDTVKSEMERRIQERKRRGDREEQSEKESTRWE